MGSADNTFKSKLQIIIYYKKPNLLYFLVKKIILGNIHLQKTDMQTIVILFAIFWFMVVLVSGKPKVAYKANQHIQYTRGKIIGGQDAPARKS